MTERFIPAQSHPNCRSTTPYGTAVPFEWLGTTLSHLIDYYQVGDVRDGFTRAVTAITGESWAAYSAGSRPHFSDINGTGAPVQFSISLGSSLRSLRFLGEVANPGMSMSERLSLSSLRLRDLVLQLDLRSASNAINDVFQTLFPEDPRLVSKWTVGIWIALAVAPGQPIRLRLYLNQRWDTVVSRYHRIARFLAKFGRVHDVALWCRLAPFVSIGAIPFGAAIEVIPGGVGHFKVYFANYAATRPYWVNLLGSMNLGHRLSQVELLAQACGLDLQQLPPGSMSPSLEFFDDPDQRGSLKIDVSCNHLRTSDAKMDRHIKRYAQDCGLDATEYREVLAFVKPPPLRTDGVSCIQYCSLGFTDPDSVRFNVYLGPPS